MDWRVIFNAIDSPAMILDLQQCILEVNQKTIEITGLSPEELIGRHCYEVFHDQKQPPPNCPIQALISSAKPQSTTMEVEVFGKYCIVSISPIFDEKGQLEKVFHIARDITEEHLAKEALRKSEEKFRTVADFNYDWEDWLGPDDRFIYVSPSVTRITGYTAKEFYADTSLRLNIVHPDDRKNLIGHQHRRLADGQLSSLEFRIITKTGDERWINHGCQKVYAEDGKYLGVRGSNRDITDRKQAESALAESQRRLKTILDSAPIGIGSSKDRRFGFFNRKMQEMFGYTAKELENQSSRILYESDDEFQRVGKIKYPLIEKYGCGAVETRMVNKAGNLLDVYLTSSPLYPGDLEKGIIYTITDITDLKKAERTKVALQTKLMEARKMEMVATLAGGVAHDFNNALTVVIGNIELLNMNPNDGHNISSCAQEVSDAARRMADLTKQLLAYARGGKYQVQEISLQQFIEQAIKEIQCSVDRSFEVLSNLDCRESSVMADRSQLQMLFNAIFTNAIEAMSGQGKLEISCSNQELTRQFIGDHPGSEYGSFVCFSVKDNGCGMDEKTLERIYEPFYSTKFAGRGLGMAAAYGIVKNHGGYISIDSKTGQGTMVEVYLPLFPPKTTAIAKTHELTATITILLIEDDEMLQDLEKRRLEALGYNVLSAHNGRQALQLAKKFQGTVDLALMDVHLPDIPADILYLQLMEICPAMKVLLCSGSALDWSAQKALNAGANGFIEKPFPMHKLREALLGMGATS